MATIVASGTGTNTATLPAGTAVNDYVVVLAYRNAATAPTLPTGWTSITARATTPSILAAGRKYDGVWTMPTFTNATRCVATTVRPASGMEAYISLSATTNGGTSATITWAAFTPAIADGSTVLLRGGVHNNPGIVPPTPALHTLIDATGTAPGYITVNKTATNSSPSATSVCSTSSTFGVVQVEVRDILPFAPQLTAYRFFNDDGNVDTCTANTAQDTALAHQKPATTQYGLRVLVSNLGNAGVSTDDFKLQIRKNGGAWLAPTDLTFGCSIGDTTQYANGNAASLNRLTGGVGTGGTGGVFVTGKAADNTDEVTDYGFQVNRYTELHYMLKLDNQWLSGGETFEFRVVTNGATTGWTYPKTPTITIPAPPTISQAAYQFFNDGTETASTSLAAVNTDITSNIYAGDIPMQLRVRLQSSNALSVPATEDFQLRYQKNGTGSWLNAVAGTVLASYSPSNVTGSYTLGDAAQVYVSYAQSFTGNGSVLSRAGFLISRRNSPVGILKAELWSHSGTFGGSSTPAALLATSAAIDISTITNIGVTAATPLTYFRFDTPYTLVNGTNYFIAVTVVMTPSATDYVHVGTNDVSPTAPGSGTYRDVAGTWGPWPTVDVIFDVGAGGNNEVTYYDSASLTDGAATTNRLGAGTGTFVAGKVADADTLVDDLGITTGNYTEVLYSIKLAKAYLANNDVIRFRVDSLSGNTLTTYTVTPQVTVRNSPFPVGVINWYDPSDLSTVTFSTAPAINALRDKSGGGWHTVQPGGSLQPNVTLGGLRSDKYSLDSSAGTGSGTYLYCAPAGVISNQKPFTAFAVIKHTGIATDRAFYGCNQAGGFLWEIDPTQKQLVNKHGVVNIAWSTGTVPSAQVVILCVTYDAAGVMTFYKNNVADGVTTNNQTFNSSPGEIAIGRGNPGQMFVGSIGEIVKFDSVLSSTDRTSVYDYLYAGWIAPPSSAGTLTATDGLDTLSGTATFGPTATLAVPDGRDTLVTAVSRTGLTKTHFLPASQFGTAVATRDITGCAWGAGDKIIVFNWTSSALTTCSAPTNANLTFTPVAGATAVSASGESNFYTWEATATGLQTNQTITLNRSFSSGQIGGIVHVVSGGSVVQADWNRTEAAFSKTVTTGSVVLYGAVDWNLTSAGKTITPGSGIATERIDSTDSVNGAYTLYAGDWTGVSAGTYSFGVTSYTGWIVTHGFVEISETAPPLNNSTFTATDGVDTLAGTGGAIAADTTSTLALTDGLDTLAAAATYTFTSTLAQADGLDTFTAVPTFGPTATLALTDGRDTLTAIPTFASTATLSLTDGNDTFTAVPAFASTATLVIADGNDTLSATPTFGPTATLVKTDGVDTFLAAGTYAFVSLLTQTDGVDTLVAAGQHTAPTFTATLVKTDGVDTLAGVSTFGPTATLALTDGVDTLTSSATTGAPTFTATLALTDGVDTLVASGQHTAPTFTATLALTDGRDTLLAAGQPTAPTFTSTLALTDGQDTLTAIPTYGPTATLALTDGRDGLTAAASAGPPPMSQGIATASHTWAVSASGNKEIQGQALWHWPVIPDDTQVEADTAPINVGTRFTVDTDTFITAIRYYRPPFYDSSYTLEIRVHKEP